MTRKFSVMLLLLLSPAVFAEMQMHGNHMAPASAKKAQSEVAKTKKTAPVANKPRIIPKGAYRVVNLVVAYKTVNFAGKLRQAISVNDQIPAPTLHFKQGDHVTINVYNHLDKGTAIHWHGIILPWQMDGVVGVSQKAIPPGGVFHYRFTLYQAGTYWYHAHADVQEQDGLYGAFLIDPPTPPHYKYNKEYVVVLSDWNNIGGEKTYTNLKKEGDYYSPRFPLQPSLQKFIHDYRKADAAGRKNLIADYKMMQQMRMSIYDISDVAYDAYLLNGQTKIQPWTARVKVGDVVRLRFIGAAGSTIYHVKIPGAEMIMVHVQGNDVRPYKITDFFIAPGETYDVLVKIKNNNPTVIYAESIDSRGKAYGALITHADQAVNYREIMPFPEPLPVTREMMQNMMMSKVGHDSMKDHGSMKMNHGSMKMDHGSTKMNHGSMVMNHQSMQEKPESMQQMPENHAMHMPTEPTIIGDQFTSPTKNALAIKTTGTKYQNLVAAVKTNNPNKPVNQIIHMELFGYMDRFMWFVNGLPEYKAKPILIEPGKRYRIIFTNNSMMRHPMHIHGHWFILRNGNGSYDPLLHTIEVPPGATAVADLDSDASGQWFFHCHHIFHMMAGMARVFQYQTIIEVVKGEMKPENYISQKTYINRPIVREDAVMPIDPTLVHHAQGHHAGFYFANFLDVGADPFNSIQEITFKGMYGPDYDKLELLSEEAEFKNGEVENADLDIFYWHLVSQFWAIKGGANYFYRPGGPYWQPGIGIEGLMPYFIETDMRAYYHNDSLKFDLEFSRDTQITNNFFIRLEIRSIFATETVLRDEIGSGLNQMRYSIRPYYRLMPGLNIYTEFEHDDAYGAYKNILRNQGDSTSENTITFGVSIIM